MHARKNTRIAGYEGTTRINKSDRKSQYLLVYALLRNPQQEYLKFLTV